MMDKRELLNSVLSGEKVQKIPCGFWHHFPSKKHMGDASVAAHLAFYEALDLDMLKIMNEHLYQIQNSIQNSEDWRRLESRTFSQIGYDSYLDEVRAIKRALAPDVPLFATVHGVLVSAYHATQIPGFFSDPNNMVSRHLREDPNSVAIGLSCVADTLIELCAQLKEIGVDGIYYAALGGESYRFTPELFSSYVKVLDKQVVDAINALDLISILHICKDQVMLDQYQGIEADIVNWAVHECAYPLVAGRSLFPKATLLGGFDDRSGVLIDGSITQIEQKVDDIVSSAGRSRLIIGADCTLSEDVAHWRLCAALNRAHVS
jgi:uroporphyrinogen decarboxylase